MSPSGPLAPRHHSHCDERARCREAVKRLRLDRDPDPKVQLPVHTSIAALLCWRYAQLVTALPKRWLTSF
jgi:hypothetical protein